MLRRLTAWLALATVVLAVFACTVPATRPTVCEEGTPGCDAPPAESPGGAVSPGGGGPTGTTPSTSGSPSSSGGPGGNDSGPEASAPVDSGSDSAPSQEDAGACKARGSACFHVQNECGCANDCCSGLSCAQVGGLTVTWCCVPVGKACGSHNDCCGNTLCNGPPGAMTCQ
jgi:hypothetical protein